MVRSDSNRAWVRVCALADVPANKAHDLYINGQRLIIVRCGDEAQILQGFCSHMYYPLVGSSVDNESCVITCSMHQSKFSVQDGSVIDWTVVQHLSGQALESVKTNKMLRTYETRLTDGDVYVLWATNNPESVRIRF